jgi:H+/Cl- antiporter ClcA
LPIPLLAGMGFVAVFAGATKTPIASTLLGIELFGAEAGLFMAIACVTAHYFSGQQGIYKHPLVGKVRFQTKVAKKHERLVQDSENEHQSSSSTEAN